MPADASNLPILHDWRQGDFAVGDIELPFIGADEDGTYIGAAVVPGVAVISQSCDIIRNHVERPFVQVAALIPANDAEMAQIEARAKPRYGFLAPLKALGLVVDLDLVANVQKELVATWGRQAGCQNDDEQRDFATALARHKQRFAFPDEFNGALKPLRTWIKRREKKANTAGQMIRAIEQIRVRCEDWANPSDDIEFIAILLGDPPAADRQSWAQNVTEIGDTVRAVYPNAIFRLTTSTELSAAEYIATDRLDLDGLSDA